MDSGYLDRTGNTTWLAPARVWLEEDNLRWAWNSGGGNQPLAVPERDLVGQFIGLADAAAVLAFANRFGVLEACVHTVCDHPGVSRTHGTSCRIPPPGSDEEGVMPVASWVHLAQKVGSLLTVAGQLQLGESPDVAELANFTHSAEQVVEEAHRGRTNAPYFIAITTAINKWLSYLSPTFVWRENTEPILSLRPTGPFGAVAFEASIMVSRTNGLSLCSGCGRTFTPRRKPRRGERHYCADCREKKIPRRDAARDFRQRSRGGTK